MVDIATLGIAIQSNDVPTATDRLKNLTTAGGQAETATGKLSSSFGNLTTYVKAAAAALGMYKLAELAKDATLLSARYDTLGAAMNVVGLNAGFSSTQMALYQAQLQRTGIAGVEARQSLTMMASAHIDLAKSSDLARVAQNAAVIAGTNSSQALERITRGIQSGEVEILKTLGLNVQWESSYQKLATTLGKTVKELTEAEKVTARTNAVLEKGKDITGAYEAAMGTVGKALTSLKRYVDDNKVAFGELFTPALGVMVDAFTESLKTLVGWFQQHRTEVQAWALSVADGFKSTLGFVKDHSEAILNVAKAYITLRAAMMAFTAVTAAAAAMSAFTTAMTAAGGVVATLGTGLAVLSGPVGWLALLTAGLVAGASAWFMWGNKAKEARTKAGLDNPASGMPDMLSSHKPGDSARYMQEAPKEMEVHLAQQKTLALADAAKKAADAEKELAAAIEATSDAFKDYLRLAAEEAPQHNEAAVMSLRWEAELKWLQSLQPTAGLDALNEQLKTLDHMMQDMPDKADQISLAIEALNKPAQEAALKLAEEAAAAQDAMAIMNGADKALIEMGAQIRKGLEDERQLRERIKVAEQTGNTSALSNLNILIQRQEQYNQSLRAQNTALDASIALEQRKGVLNGSIVGFDNGKAIYADGRDMKNRAPSYVSDSALMGGSSNPQGSGGYSSGVRFVNANGQPLGSYATGTPYVPQTGMYMLHQGEKVTPANQSASSADTYNITVVTQATDSDSIAREIAPAVAKYMNRKAA